MPERQQDAEGGALSRRSPGLDAAAVALDDLAADRQADAAPLVLAPAVQPLEHAEDPLRIFVLEADAVVREAELAVRAGHLRRQEASVGGGGRPGRHADAG